MRLVFRSIGVLRFGKGFLVDLLGWNLSMRFITEFRKVNFDGMTFTYMVDGGESCRRVS